MKKFTISTLLLFTALSVFSQTMEWKLQRESRVQDVLRSVSFADTSNGWAVGAEGIITYYNGTTWTDVVGVPAVEYREVYALDKSNVWVVGDSVILKYDGTKWEVNKSFPNKNIKSISFINSNSAFAVGDDNFFATYDGTTWTEQTSSVSFESIKCLDMENIWALGSDYAMYKYVSNNWVKQTISGSPYIQSFDVVSANKVWAVGYNLNFQGILCSYNGTSWTAEKKGDANPLYSVSFMDNTHGVIIGENENFLYDGSGWSSIADTISAIGSYDIDYVDAKHVWAVGNGGAIFAYVAVPDTTPVSINNIAANSANLNQNYPNPFSATTEISYNVAERSNVSLKVFDVAGKEVATLVNEDKAAGNYKVSFDAKELPSGVYYYQLKNNAGVISKRMSVVR